MKTIYVKPDSRGRVVLNKATDKLASLYRIVTEGNRIILEPVEESKKESHWLLKAENKQLLEELKQGLKESYEGKTESWEGIKHKYKG